MLGIQYPFITRGIRLGTVQHAVMSQTKAFPAIRTRITPSWPWHRSSSTITTSPEDKNALLEMQASLSPFHPQQTLKKLKEYNADGAGERLSVRLDGCRVKLAACLQL